VRKQRNRIILVCCLAVLAGWAALFAWDREPTYQGRPLSYWTYLYTASRFHWPHPEAPQAWSRNAEAAKAVRAIGPAAVPYLLQWIGYEPNNQRAKLAEFIRTFRKGPLTRLIPDGNSPDKEWLRAVSASDGFNILGPDAASAAPELLRLAQRSRNPAGAQKIVEALASLGPQGIVALGQLLTNAPAPSSPEAGAHARSTALFQLGSMGRNAIPAIPAVVECRTDLDKDIAAQADVVLNSIVVTVVSESLAGLAGRPRGITPSLVDLLTSAAPEARQATTNAIFEIAPEFLNKALAK